MQHPSSVCSHHSVPATTLPDRLHVTSDSLLALNNNNLQGNWALLIILAENKNTHN